MFPEIFRDDVFRLETQRLWLRWPTARDETAIERLAGDNAVAEWTARIPHPFTKGSAASFIYSARVGNAQGAGLTFALAPLAKPHDLLGIVSLNSEDGVPTLGYWVGRPFWGRGLMSEAVDALVRTTFALTDLDVVAASARVDNAGSRRVLEKCEFLETGTRRTHFPARNTAFDCVQFSRERTTHATRPIDARRDVIL